MTPRPYQVAGALWLAQSRRAMLADPPGLGKTAQAILAAKAVNAKSIWVICPAIAVHNWHREWKLWWPEGQEPKVVSYDKVVRDRGVRLQISQGADVLILDEAHYLKTRDSLRTKVIYNPSFPQKGLASRASFCWALSGTFAPNDVSEYWTHLRALFPQLIPGSGGHPLSHDEFLQKFTHWTPSAFGPKIHGVRNRPELSRLLHIAGLRREIADVLPDLPPMTWGVVTVAATEARAAIDALEFSHDVEELRRRIDTDDDFHAFAVHLATLRRLIGQAKAKPLASLIAAELFEDHYRKLVVWAHHKDVIAALAEALTHYGAVTLDGSTPNSTRARIIDQFQSDPACRVFIGQLQAGGTAINLTAANQVLFAESSWVPAENVQAAKRCHRMGQRLPVFVRVSALADSIDELVAATIQRKVRNHLEVGDLYAVAD